MTAGGLLPPPLSVLGGRGGGVFRKALVRSLWTVSSERLDPPVPSAVPPETLLGRGGAACIDLAVDPDLLADAAGAVTGPTYLPHDGRIGSEGTGQERGN